MEYRDELAIAKKAQQMLNNALKSKTKSFAEHYAGKKEGEPSLKDAKAIYRVKHYGKKKDGNQQIFMRALTIRMAKHGFVQHYGVDTIRQGGKRKRKTGKEYHFGGHYFKMKSRPFINEAISNSGVIDFVSQNIAELRGKVFAEELIFPLSNFAK